MFCWSGLVFGDTEGVGCRFHVLPARTRFRRYRGRRVPFSSFACPDSFSAEPRASGPVFKFCAPVLVFGGTEGVGSLFHVLRARTRFRRYQGRRVSLSCFALPDSLSSVSRASGLVFMFCTPGLVFGDTEGVESRYLVLRARTHFRRIPRASSPSFMFCAPEIVFGGSEGVRSRFHVLCSRTHFRR
jgi:hypothetical protein